ncbi:FAD-dependent oxidoreductase, partial [Nonomuraea sp. NPDC050405]|uniref:FAD-dependent oxidoreductase n=1 Tax=Nonomuraea sp. NPDC050405 TaxID=3154509 RepID=UPI0033F4B611
MTEAAPALRQAEIVVHGATSGGVRAAVAAARLGLDAVLVEPGRHVGGMTSGGLGRTDVGVLATMMLPEEIIAIPLSLVLADLPLFHNDLIG